MGVGDAGSAIVQRRPGADRVKGLTHGPNMVRVFEPLILRLAAQSSAL